MKIIALRRDPNSGSVIEIDEHLTAANALGVTEQLNHENLMVGYSPEWTVYLVDGQHWFELTNYDNSWARWEFIQYLKSVGGTYAGFKAENFEDPSKEDF